MNTSSAQQAEDDDDLFRCAICGVSESDSSNLTSQSSLLTNIAVGCGHQFCTSCVERELSRRKELPCPICDTLVKRVNLSTRTQDDVQSERDTSWRRRVKKVFNKVETDFPDLLKYNNYLEEVEDIIYSIVNEEPNAEEAKARVKREEEANKAEIVIRQSQRADEERSIADRIASEQRETERRKRDAVEEEQAIADTKRKLKQETTEFLLGEREEVSAELRAAQMQGYRNELKRQGRGSQAAGIINQPRVHEPPEGLSHREHKKPDREFLRKRQSAGAGVPSGSIAASERNWNETVSSLFAKVAM
mmetsp:Transcript_7292/g.10320  ORF Transcript_7292/g.10320 Transcript_7292/m.10320 type:complete len:305 (+) Transcript_7292:191-1105(+)